MAEFTIKLEESDIVTSKLGNNYMIKANGVNVIFTPEALEELVKDFENIKEASIKYVGVIAYNINDFLDFVKQFGEPKHSPQHKYKVNDTVYYRILKACDLCGWRFDEVVETELAYQSKEYEKIKEGIRYCIASKK